MVLVIGLLLSLELSAVPTRSPLLLKVSNSQVPLAALAIFLWVELSVEKLRQLCAELIKVFNQIDLELPGLTWMVNWFLPCSEYHVRYRLALNCKLKLYNFICVPQNTPCYFRMKLAMILLLCFRSWQNYELTPQPKYKRLLEIFCNVWVILFEFVSVRNYLEAHWRCFALRLRARRLLLIQTKYILPA